MDTVTRQLSLLDQGRPEEVLEDAVFALGGWQKAAAGIWPTESPIERGRHLRACLDPARREKLSEGERELLCVLAADAGCLTPLARLCARCGCKPPEPISPETQEGEAVTAVREGIDTLRAALEALTAAQERQARVRSIR